MAEQAGTTAEAPLYFKWVRNEDESINWGRVIISLALTALAAYVSVQAQRAGSDPDVLRTLRMGVAQKKITVGVRIQRAGKAIEEAGWAAYESARG